MKKGWQTKTLGEVCAFDKAQGIHRGLPYVGLEHIESHTARFIGSIEPQPVKSSTFRFSDEHVLYGRLRPYLNKALAPDFEGHCSTEIFPLKPRPELSREYLLFWLLADETCDRINATCTGARMPRAQMNDVLGFEIPVPPLAEQQRIVGLLDEAFEGLATAKANAEQNLQNARALFESHLQSVFTQRGPGWVEKPLGELCDILDNQRKPITKRDRVAGDIPYYGATCIQDYVKDFIFDEPLVLVGEDGAKWKSGDKTAFAVSGKCWVNNHAHVLRPHRDKTTDYWLISFLSHSDLTPFVSGLTVPKLNQGNLREIPIPLPPISIQRQLAETAESLEEETQRLARLYERKHAALEALKKSLLHQAFSGGL